MKRLRHAPLGLIGRIFAILLFAVLIEFGASTFFYERASQFSVRDDEARRLAEHLIIAHKLLSEQPADERPALARDLTTTRYDIGWGVKLPPALKIAPSLERIHTQVLTWEPSLRETDMRMRLVGSARSAMIQGGLKLPDGSWMRFGTRVPLGQLGWSWERMLLALAPAVALILLSGVLLRQMLLPLRRLADAAEKVGSNGAGEVSPGGPGEVRRVIQAFNRMQSRIHRLIADRTQALAAVGHDLRTPLARMRLRTDAVADAQLQSTLQADIGEMEAMIGSLLAYLGGEGDGEQPAKIDLAVLCRTLADDAADRGRNATYHGPAHLEVTLRPTGFKRALVNLVENALHHAHSVALSLYPAVDEIIVGVEDDGPGIPEEALASVMEPFVRIDQARARDTKGLGLGLAITVRAVEAEGGKLTLRNRSQGGLRAEIRLLHGPG